MNGVADKLNVDDETLESVQLFFTVGLRFTQDEKQFGTSSDFASAPTL